MENWRNGSYIYICHDWVVSVSLIMKVGSSERYCRQSVRVLECSYTEHTKASKMNGQDSSAPKASKINGLKKPSPPCAYKNHRLQQEREMFSEMAVHHSPRSWHLNKLFFLLPQHLSHKLAFIVACNWTCIFSYKNWPPEKRL